jgi:hypothetical protein
MLKALTAALALAASALPVHAETIALGVGVTACNKISAAYSERSADINYLDSVISSWASGFMSAANMARYLNSTDTQNLATTKWQDQVVSIRRYCKHNPNKEVMDAVMELYNGLSSNVDAKQPE